mgnify:CR=1 FL=1
MRSEQLNSYITKFDATVTAVDNRADGTFVALSDSLFYPESGGQLADTGTLAGQPVLSVQLVDGVRWHEVAEAPSVGSTVRGVVDWATRYVHMQRHTAQHLVSEALLRSNPAFATVSVSLRGPDITIELEHEPTQAELAHTFAEANRVARENPPVFAFTVTQSELARYTLRRPAPNVGEVRLIAIGDYDLSACGGTHVKQLAEVLPLLLVKTERVRGDHTRIVFRAGEEAAQLGQFSSETLTSIANDLSTSREEVAPRVAQLGEEVQALQASVQQWHTQWASEVAAQYEPGVVALALSEETAAALPALGKAFAAKPGMVALLCAPSARGTNVLFAASPDVATDLRPHFTEVLGAHGGRGGGRPEWLQGAAPATPADVYTSLEQLKTLLTE